MKQGSVRRQSRSSINLAAAGLVVAIAFLTIAFFSPAGQSKANDKGKSDDFTRVYEHTYDEVFQASVEEIERMGMFVSAKDKDKGQISGYGVYQATSRSLPRTVKMTFDIHVATVSAKPETQLTINAKGKGSMTGWVEESFKNDFLQGLQKVLATYK